LYVPDWIFRLMNPAGIRGPGTAWGGRTVYFGSGQQRLILQVSSVKNAFSG